MKTLNILGLQCSDMGHIVFLQHVFCFPLQLDIDNRLTKHNPTTGMLLIWYRLMVGTTYFSYELHQAKISFWGICVASTSMVSDLIGVSLSWYLFVCSEVLWLSQLIGVMLSMVSLHKYTFTGQSSKRLTSIVHILSPETDNCPSWISGRERITLEKMIPQPPGYQSDGHPTEPPRLAYHGIEL